MLPFILIPWAALGLSIPVAKALGIASRAISRKRKGKKSSLRDIVGDVRFVQAAENAAYKETAKCLCGGDDAPEMLVKGISLTMKCATHFATPSASDIIEGVSSEIPTKAD